MFLGGLQAPSGSAPQAILQYVPGSCFLVCENATNLGILFYITQSGFWPIKPAVLHAIYLFLNIDSVFKSFHLVKNILFVLILRLKLRAIVLLSSALGLKTG